MPKYVPVPERIARLSMPEPNSGCWLWVGCLDFCGYAKLHVRTSDGNETLAHRASFRAYIGPIPPGTEIDHICNMRCCVNPQHLRAITHAENVGRADYKTNHRNRVKTHCKRGHLFSPANTRIEYWSGLVMRKCRICRRERASAKRAALICEAA